MYIIYSLHAGPSYRAAFASGAYGLGFIGFCGIAGVSPSVLPRVYRFFEAISLLAMPSESCPRPCAPGESIPPSKSSRVPPEDEQIQYQGYMNTTWATWVLRTVAPARACSELLAYSLRAGPSYRGAFVYRAYGLGF